MNVAEEAAGLLLAFVDAIGKPIHNLIVKVFVDGEPQPKEYKTDHQGLLPQIDFGTTKVTGKVCAIVPTGEMQDVFQFNLSGGLEERLLRSPYLLLSGTTQPHEGRASTEQPIKVKKPGESADKRSPNGNPVKEITGMDCPNGDNLRLDYNGKFRDMILRASERSGISPQAIAAIIDAESAKKKYVEKVEWVVKGVVQKDKKGHVKLVDKAHYEWDPNCKALAGGSAAGLTQFVKGTWLGEAMRKGTYLHEKALELKYIGEETKTITVKKATKKHPAVTKTETKLVVKQEGKLLDLRFDPEFSINASVDYALDNLQHLEANGIKVSSLNDADKAKVIYLAHHLGFRDALRFIKNEIEEEDKKIQRKNGKYYTQYGAETLLKAQFVDKKKAEKMAALDDDSYVRAHRNWLCSTLIDNKIRVENFACSLEGLPVSRSMNDIITSVGGSHPEGYP